MTRAEKEDVDGLFSDSGYYYLPTLSVGEYLVIRPRYSSATSMLEPTRCKYLAHKSLATPALKRDRPLCCDEE